MAKLLTQRTDSTNEPKPVFTAEYKKYTGGFAKVKTNKPTTTTTKTKLGRVKLDLKEYLHEREYFFYQLLSS